MQSFSEITGKYGEIFILFLLLSVSELNTSWKKKKLVIILVISTFSGILTLGLAVWFLLHKKRIMTMGMPTKLLK